MLLLTIKGKEATFAMVLMTADSLLRRKDIKGFYDNSYLPIPPQKQQPRQEAIEENS